MALTKDVDVDKITVRAPYNGVELRTATRVYEDDQMLSISFSREYVDCGTLDDSDNFVDTDISGYSPIIQGVMNAVWTDQIKTDFKARLIANKG